MVERRFGVGHQRLAVGVEVLEADVVQRQLAKINEPLQRGLAAADSVFGLVDTDTEADTGKQTPARAQGQLSLNDVSFQYLDADGQPLVADAKPALDHVSLHIAAGETVALVGSSGSGKTTLASLLPRFYDVSGGAITLDGVDLRDYSLAGLRQQIALVSQDVVLFNDTLAANIAYGDPAPSQERIEAAARAAHAHEFIVRQPQGYQSPAWSCRCPSCPPAPPFRRPRCRAPAP